MMMTLDLRSTVVAVIGFAAGVAAVSLLPSGMLWPTQHADAQVVQLRKLADLPPVRVVRPRLILNIDPKHRSSVPAFEP